MHPRTSGLPSAFDSSTHQRRLISRSFISVYLVNKRLLAYNEGGITTFLRTLLNRLKHGTFLYPFEIIYNFNIPRKKRVYSIKYEVSEHDHTILFKKKKRLEYLNKIPRNEFSLVVHGVWNICQLDIWSQANQNHAPLHRRV